MNVKEQTKVIKFDGTHLEALGFSVCAMQGSSCNSANTEKHSI